MMNPFVQNFGHIKALSSLIDERYYKLFISIVSFTKRCTFKVEPEYRKIASNELIVYDIELSEFIHRKESVLKLQHKQPLLSENDISTIFQAFLKANITDPEVREEHVQALKGVTTPKSSCVICHKAVSDKVKAYCLSKESFKGEVYCFEHQKNIKN